MLSFHLGSVETSASIEHDKYFQAIISSTPMGSGSPSSQHYSNFSPGMSSTGSPTDSMSSLDSIMTEDLHKHQNPLARVVKHKLRNSGGKAKCESNT